MRILFVTIADSTHAVRWMSQLHGLGWDLHLMPVWQHQPPHRAHREVTVHDVFRHPDANYDATFRQTARVRWPLAQGRTKAQRFLEAVTLGWAGYPARLARLIEGLRPDVVHTMEMQQAGYVMAACRRLYPAARGVPWIYSCWGSDIYLYKDRPEHADRVREVVRGCDYFIADCQRDVALARELGMGGEVLGVFPGGGGYDVARAAALRQPGPTSARRTIAVKGYQGTGPYGCGRGLVAIRALRRCGASLLRGYELAIYSGADSVVREGREVAAELGMKLTVLPPSPPDEVLRIMGRSRIGIGLSVSDGMPNTMLEAMLMGAFPIQSDTVSPREYIEDGENGLVVPPEDEGAVAGALRAALSRDELVDRAAEANFRLVASRVDRGAVRAEVIAAYERVVRQSDVIAGDLDRAGDLPHDRDNVGGRVGDEGRGDGAGDGHEGADDDHEECAGAGGGAPVGRNRV